VHFEVMKSCRALLLLALLAASFHVQADRPKIGLALAGGGAKGSAHIAVLELLEANNIPVDYIAGTSIGAYVGGLYALGYSAAEIKEIMFSADFSSGFSDTIPREQLPFREKRQTDLFNTQLEAGFRYGEFRFPWGLLYGQSMMRVYRQSAGNIPNFTSFDDLAIPFSAVATDLATSDVVVLDSGNLLKAMKASATVPGVLVPVVIDDQFLVDGGMAENLPVTQVKKMGADIVIAVDIGSTLADAEQIKSAFGVMGQLSNFLTIKNLRAQKELLGENDIYIRPKIDDMGPADFSDLAKAYDRGRIAAEEKIGALKVLSIGADEYRQNQQQKKAKFEALMHAMDEPVVEIILFNQSSYNDEFLLHILGLQSGESISTEALIEAIDRVYAMDKFERVDAEFEQREDGRVLIVEVVEKSWGPNYLEVGIGWENDFTLDSVFNLDLSYTIGNVSDNNGEWRNEIGLGTDNNFRTELYLPQNRTHTIYQSIVYEYRKEGREFFIENDPSFSYERTIHRADWAIGFNLSHLTSIEFGATYEEGEFDNAVIFQESLDYDSPGFFVRLGYDSLDRISLPTRGNRLTLSLTRWNESVSGDPLFGERADNDYDSIQTQLEWKSAISTGNNVFGARVSIAHVDSDIDQSVHHSELGGFLNLSGYHKNALIGNNMAFGLVSYQYDLGRGLLGLKSIPVYVGASLEVGNAWEASESIDFGDLIQAGSIFAGTDSKLGPVLLGFGFSEDGNEAAYFIAGTNF